MFKGKDEKKQPFENIQWPAFGKCHIKMAGTKSFSDYCKLHPVWTLAETKENQLVCTMHTPVQIFKSESDPTLKEHLVSENFSNFSSL